MLIIADDLSGAADCASAFHKAGLAATVRLDVDRRADEPVSFEQVCAVDADSRRLAPAEAALRQVTALARHGSDAQWIYKKIDSTLRGQVGAELAALIPGCGLAIVAPAFVQAGRTTIQGHQYLDGVPLEQTAIWRTEGLPGTAHIPALLQAHGITVAALTLGDIRRGAGPLQAQLEQLAAAGTQAVVCDAQNDTDLALIAQASIPMKTPRFWVGSAGLAQHLAPPVEAACASAGVPAGAFSDGMAPLTVAGAILTVVGSLSARSREQAAQLMTVGQVQALEVPASVLRSGPRTAQWQTMEQTLGDWLAAGLDVLLTVASAEFIEIHEGQMLCTALAELIAPSGRHLGGLIATGGETARAILSALGATGLVLQGEIEAGVPLSIARGMRAIPVVTKAGAFGSSTTLARSLQTLRAMRSGAASAASYTALPQPGQPSLSLSKANLTP